MSLILDILVGQENPTVYSKMKFQKIIEYHKNEKTSPIDGDEERIIKGALTFSDKKVKEIMTPKSKIFALEKEDKLSTKLIQKIKNTGFSRVPIYSSKFDNMIDVLLVKNLVGYEINNQKISSFCRGNIYTINENCLLDSVLNKFLNTRSHLFTVHNQSRQVIGLVTIEDVLEEILKKEIVDETDRGEFKRE